MGISIILMSSCAFVERFNGGDDYAQAGSQGDLYIPPELVTPEWNDSLKIAQTGSDRVSALDTYGKALIWSLSVTKSHWIIQKSAASSATIKKNQSLSYARPK